ncbi:HETERODIMERIC GERANYLGERANYL PYROPHOSPHATE SYNTHASE SMALL SUBUNIT CHLOROPLASTIC-LIKE [Salix purpurea]|uniref:HETERODIMERIC GERANYLGERANYL PYROPHOSPHATE SYNTHASE SMALL SUBUNIT CHLOROPLASTIC-LIKE n=1 Tax=Salix purpurea TaxID=77065 RepID=A0A9Q0W3G2_SALPP|nr:HETERODIMERIC GERANYLGERANYL PYROPHOSPHATE SYNTHASE SMALL SUBUNIT CHLOROPLASTIC-LIKE [Salix purpurea]
MPSSAAAIPAINGNPFLPHLRRSNLNRPLLFHRPRIVAVTATSNAAATSSTSYLTSVNDEIDAHLKQAIPLRPPLSVFQPMHHLTFAAPRTTAPALCIAACELVGGHRRQAMAAAAALRLMNAAALTRDHILSGRNRDRIGHSFGSNIELLTGDGMVPFGLELLARSDDLTQSNSERILRAIIEITRAMGSQGMAQGERNHSHHGRPDHSELVCRKKEAGIHGCAGAVGAILGGGTEEEIEKLRRYGLYVGSMQGVLSNWDERKEKVSMENVLKELENLALQELEGFDRGNVQAISSLLATNFGDD